MENINLESTENEIIDEIETYDISPENRNILYQPSDEKVGNLYQEFKARELDIQPDFQRLYVWDKQKATRLIESALLGIPIPVVYLSKEEDGNRSVIDGQQRLTSFFSFIDGKFPDGKDFRLGKMQIFEELTGKAFGDLEKKNQKKIKDCLIRTITFQECNNSDLKFNVFERLNTGSVALNDQELRNCVYRGDYNNLLRELATDETFKKIVGFDKNQCRMQDVELVLRFAAFFNNGYIKYKSPIKSFLNEEMQNHKVITEKFSDNVRKAFKTSVFLIYSVFGEKTFRNYILGNEQNVSGTWEPKQFNTSLYDILMWGFTAYSDKNLVMRHSDQIKEAYIDLITSDREFNDAISRSTSSQKAVRTRFQKWQDALAAILNDDTPQKRCFSFELKKSLYETNPTCAICGQQITTIDDAAVDHIEQYWRGGKTIPENARLTHRFCNCSRSKND